MRYFVSAVFTLMFFGLSAVMAQQSPRPAKNATSSDACEKGCRTFCEKRVEQKIAPNFMACNLTCLHQTCGRNNAR